MNMPNGLAETFRAIVKSVKNGISLGSLDSTKALRLDGWRLEMKRKRNDQKVSIG